MYFVQVLQHHDFCSLFVSMYSDKLNLLPVWLDARFICFEIKALFKVEINIKAILSDKQKLCL